MANKKITFAVPSTNIRTPTRSRFSFAGPPGSMPRMSLGNPASVSRPSHMRQSMHTASNAPRDTSEKSVQQSMVRKIHEFLFEMDQEDAPSEKVIMKPTQKDFIIIFERIYESIAPGYEFGSSKLGEEIPRLFNALGYPFVIKPSTLQTIGASHSWHYLLHALAWLVDLVKIQMEIEKCTSDVLLGQDEGNGNLRSVRYSWMMSSYKEMCAKKLVIDDEYCATKTDALHKWFENQEDYEAQIKNANDNVELIMRECKELENEPGKSNGLKDDIRRTEEDIRKAIDYNEQLKVLELASIEELEMHSQQSAEVEYSVNELKEQLDDLKLRISEQATGSSHLTGSEARAIMTEHSQVRLQLRQYTAEMDVLGRDHWKMQPRLNEQFTQLLSQYRKVVSDVRNVRNDIFGEASDSGDHGGNPTDIKEIQRLIRSDVRLSLDKTIRDLNEELQRLDGEIEKMQSKIASLKTHHEVEAERMVEEERRHGKQILIIQRETDSFSKERQQIAGLIEGLENSKEGLEGENKKIDDLKQEYLNEQILLGKTEEAYQLNWNEVEKKVTEEMTPLIEHLEAIKDLRKKMVTQLNILSDTTEDALQETNQKRRELLSMLSSGNY